MDSKGKVVKTAEDSDYRALAQFRSHIRRYLDFTDQAARNAGIEPKQYQLLLAIKGLSEDLEPTVGVLAQQLRLRHHSTVELINRAEANAFVKRFREGPRVLVHLTNKGQRILAKVVEDRLQELRVEGPILVQALQQLIDTDRLAARKRH